MEEQKNGIDIDNLNDFYHHCNQELNLNVIGLMCIPPQSVSVKDFFKDDPIEQISWFE